MTSISSKLFAEQFGDLLALLWKTMYVCVYNYTAIQTVMVYSLRITKWYIERIYLMSLALPLCLHTAHVQNWHVLTLCVLPQAEVLRVFISLPCVRVGISFAGSRCLTW